MAFKKRDLAAKPKPSAQPKPVPAPVPKIDDSAVLRAMDDLRGELGTITAQQQDVLDRFMTSMRSEFNRMKKDMAARKWRFDVSYNTDGDIDTITATPENN